MFKLVAVGGKIRGQEFNLNEGENRFGRSSENEFTLNIDGVSKRHMSLTVNKDSCYLEDLGSSNGTFVNGKLLKNKTLVDGDKIALPNVIFQLVEIKEKKIFVKKKGLKIQNTAENDEQYDEDEKTPDSLAGKAIWFFKTKFMPILYGFNQQYEWRVIFGVLLFLFISINIFLIIYPIMRDSKKLLIYEVALRGKQYADEVARANSIPLSRRDLDKLDTGFLDEAEGITGYELFDQDGRIVRPIGKLNTYINDPLSVDALNYYKDPKNVTSTFTTALAKGEIGIARSIRTYDLKLGREETVGYISIRFSPETLVIDSANNSKAFLESLLTSCGVAIIFFASIYFLTIRPIEEMRKQIELALRGKLQEIDSKQLFDELKPLRSTINSIVQRVKEYQSAESGGQMMSQDDEAPYVRTLKEFLQGAAGATLVMDSEKRIVALNLEAEDLLGIRQNASEGQSILDCTRDQGLGATIIDLCDQSVNADGTHQKESYEIGGKDISINTIAMIGKDRFAKGFYVTFLRNE